MNLDKPNLLLVQYDVGDLYLVSTSFFSQEYFVTYGSPEIGERDENGLLKIVLKVVEGPVPGENVSTEQILHPAVHVVNLGTDFTIVQEEGKDAIDGEVEVTVLMGQADDPDSFETNARSLKPGKAKFISSGGESRPVEG